MHTLTFRSRSTTVTASKDPTHTKTDTEFYFLNLYFNLIILEEQNSLVSIVTVLKAGHLGFDSRQGKEGIYFSFPPRLWSPPSLLSNGYQLGGGSYPGSKEAVASK
jgi:hypothetical protein